MFTLSTFRSLYRYPFAIFDSIPPHSYHFHPLSLSLSPSLSLSISAFRSPYFCHFRVKPLHSHHLHLCFLSPFFELCSLVLSISRSQSSYIFRFKTHALLHFTIVFSSPFGTLASHSFRIQMVKNSNEKT